MTSLGNDSTIRLTVGDQGPGIPENDRERVIGRFIRLEQSRTKPGSGLGLQSGVGGRPLHGGELSSKTMRPGWGDHRTAAGAFRFVDLTFRR